ncbi:nucleoside recognition domain-containing protein [Vibrio sp. PP-XX7]
MKIRSNLSYLKFQQWVTPVFEPIGVEAKNWQATVGIITGIFAKEAVVGTLNSLYSSDASGSSDNFDLVASFQQALATIPQNLMGLNFADPLGVEVGDLSDTKQVAEEQGVDVSIFGNLKQNFDGASAAFSYLIFILLYTPCVAAMGAYVREFGARYAKFIAIWTFGLAYSLATLFNQATHFIHHPVESGLWIVGIIMSGWLLYRWLKRKGNVLQQLEVQLV